MNYFAGNITLVDNKSISGIGYDYIENISKDGNKVLFIFGETELNSSIELVSYFEEKLGKLKNHDISISTEDKLDILHGTYTEGVYELATFEGEETTFEEIQERFEGFDEIVSIREAEVSKRFGNKVIKADFVY